MKFRTVKKRIRRHITWFAKHKIPKAFKDRRDRKAWIDYLVKCLVESKRRDSSWKTFLKLPEAWQTKN